LVVGTHVVSVCLFAAANANWLEDWAPARAIYDGRVGRQADDALTEEEQAFIDANGGGRSVREERGSSGSPEQMGGSNMRCKPNGPGISDGIASCTGHQNGCPCSTSCMQKSDCKGYDEGGWKLFGRWHVCKYYFGSGGVMPESLPATGSRARQPGATSTCMAVWY